MNNGLTWLDECALVRQERDWRGRNSDSEHIRGEHNCRKKKAAGNLQYELAPLGETLMFCRKIRKNIYLYKWLRQKTIYGRHPLEGRYPAVSESVPVSHLSVWCHAISYYLPQNRPPCPLVIALSTQMTFEKRLSFGLFPKTPKHTYSQKGLKGTKRRLKSVKKIQQRHFAAIPGQKPLSKRLLQNTGKTWFSLSSIVTSNPPSPPPTQTQTQNSSSSDGCWNGVD